MKNPLAIVFPCLALLAACVEEPPAMTPMEVQSLQSRSFEEPQEVVFASVISVFQDLGYTIKSADSDTGFITAESATDSTYDIFFGNTYTQQTAATAFVESVGDATILRINFVEFNRSSSTYGQTTRQDVPIHDAELYQQAFERIENAIFVRSA